MCSRSTARELSAINVTRRSRSVFNPSRMASGQMTDRGCSAGPDERPQQLDDLLGVPPSLASPGGVAKAVQGFADLHVRHALPPQFDGLGVNIGINGPE